MKVVIVGGGFGGVRAALNLSGRPGIDVVLISKQPYFEYHAALYRTATGRSPFEVAINLTDFFNHHPNIEVVEDEITKLHLNDQRVEGASGSNYSFDRLILAVGSVTQYFGIKGLADYSYGVRTIQEALELKRHIHEGLLSSQWPERNYVVIGGGASGVELAAELMLYLQHVRQRHRINTEFNVYLLEASSNLLPSLPATFTRGIENRLAKLGVKVLLDTAVKSETINKIQLPKGSIQSHTVIWTAGVAINPLLAGLGTAGRVKVNQQLEYAAGVYVIGDSAATKYSGMAQTAIHDANFVTANIIRDSKHQPLQPYQPQRPVYAIPVGARWSAVLWGNLKLYGYGGWLLRRAADLLLYFRFLPLGSALAAWRYGFSPEEACEVCHR